MLAQDDYDLDGSSSSATSSPPTLARLLSLSDLHIYLTVPFVLSWSCSERPGLRGTCWSDTAPVREMIATARTACSATSSTRRARCEGVEVLKEPERFRDLGRSARRLVEERYSLDVILPQMKSFYEEAAAAGT